MDPFVIDLHSDLLSFLSESPGRRPDDPASRSSHPQLLKGGVKLQTLAIYTATGFNSVAKAKAQVETFLKLLEHYSPLFASCDLLLHKEQIQILPAIENASCFASESEPLSAAFLRLEGYLKQLGRLLYIGMTWESENRFGGGNLSTVGLKEDGQRLLEWMHGKKISIDMSHTSDRLAYDILHFIEQKNLEVPVLASHSNFRAVSNYPRNLPDDIAKEIIRRKGLIGMNFFAPFVHPTDPSAILRHVEYALELGGADALSFGADFFYVEDFSNMRKKYQRQDVFYPELGDASVYPSVLRLFADKLHMQEEQLKKIAHGNALRFLSDLFAHGFVA